jgi:hypothetical protein
MARAAYTCRVILCSVAVVCSPACTPTYRPPTPDLGVTIRASPNPVPRGFGYEVLVTVTNPNPLLRPVGSPPPPLPGADVAQAQLILGINPGGQNAVLLTRKYPPELTTFSCQANIEGTAEICSIGPLRNGGLYTIGSVYRPPPRGGGLPGPITFGASIDPSNAVAERDETNNNAQVIVSFQ